jgi:hypothetical protein
MIDLGSVVTRVREQCPSFRLVDFSATFEALKARGLPALPGTFVLPGQETPVANKLGTGAIHNPVRFRFRTYHVAKYAGDAWGAQAKDLLAPLRKEVINALFGWRLPDPAAGEPGEVVVKVDSACEFGGADFVQFLDGALVFYDQFEFNGYYRRVS